MSTKVLFEAIDDAHKQGDVEKTLVEVRKLAVSEVGYRIWKMDQVRKDDIIQEIVIAVWESTPEFNGGYPYSWWVTGIIKHKVKDAIRRKIAEGRAFISLSRPILNDEGKVVPMIDLIEDGTTDFMTSYPNEDSYEAYALRADGFSVKEIAVKLGKTYDAMRKQFSRWMERMQEDTGRRLWSERSPDMDQRLRMAERMVGASQKAERRGHIEITVEGLVDAVTM